MSRRSSARDATRGARLLIAVATLVALIAGCAGGEHVAFETRAVSVAGGGAGPTATTGPAVQGGLLPATAATPASTGARAPGPSSAGARGSGTAASPAAGEPIRIGTVLPLQGGQRDFGEPVLRTTQAYVDEVNARGGVNGHPLELVAYSACLVCQDESLQAVRRLVEQDHVFALVNTYVMAVAFQPVIPYLAQKGIPLIQGGAENQTSDALSPVNFATAPPGAGFYARFMPFMVQQYKSVKQVAITYLNVPSEANGVPILKGELHRRGIEVVDEEPMEAAEDAVTNMDSVVIRMRTKGAQAVVSTNPVVLVYGRLAASRQQWPVPWIGEAAWSHLGEDSCGRICDDLVLTDTAGLSFIDRDSPQMHQYIDTMARRYPGGRITGHTLAAWVGMQLFTQVLAGLPTPDRGAFLRAMNQVRNLDLGTCSPLTFTPDRHLGGTASTLLKFRNGRYVRVSDPITAEAIPG